MTTKQLYKEIDKHFTEKLKDHGLAYSLRKLRILDIYRVRIGKFNKFTDPYVQGEIDFQWKGLGSSIIEQFEYLLDIEIKENNNE